LQVNKAFQEILKMEIINISFDRLRKEHWSELETKNVKLVIDFIQYLMNNHDFETVLSKFGNSNYLQHNRSIPDGMEALTRYVADFAKRFPEYTYDVKHVYADNDVVIFHSHATLKAKDRGNDKRGLNIIDIWRVSDGEIVEHWDALQPMDSSMRFYNLLAGGKIQNSNGVY